MAHAQKPDFFFPRNGRVHLNRWRRQFSRLLAAELCASAWVMLDRPHSEVAWEYWLPTPFASFPLTSPPVRHRVPPGSERALTKKTNVSSKLLCVVIHWQNVATLQECKSILAQDISIDNSIWVVMQWKRRLIFHSLSSYVMETGRHNIWDKIKSGHSKRYRGNRLIPTGDNLRNPLLGEFAKPLKATISFVMSVRPSVRM